MKNDVSDGIETLMCDIAPKKGGDEGRNPNVEGGEYGENRRRVNVCVCQLLYSVSFLWVMATSSDGAYYLAQGALVCLGREKSDRAVK